MGVLKCACGAEAEGKTFEEADTKIDHGIALSIPGPACSGDPARTTWDANGGYDKDGKLIVKNPKPVASREVVMLVGKDAKEKSSSDDKDKKTIESLKQKLSEVGKELKELKSKNTAKSPGKTGPEPSKSGK